MKPSYFGAAATTVKNVQIKNGILGLTSRDRVHGTAPEASLLTHVVFKDVVSCVVCKDFISHGIQFNGFNGFNCLTIDNVETGTNAQIKTLVPRFEYFANFYDSDENTYTFGGIKQKNLEADVSLSNDKDYASKEILEEMIYYGMNMAFDFVTERKTERELHADYDCYYNQNVYL